MTAIAELFDGNSEIEEVDLLEIVQNASENVKKIIILLSNNWYMEIYIWINLFIYVFILI